MTSTTTDIAAVSEDAAQVVGDRESFILRPTCWAGGASDVGRYHAPNQDAVAMAAGQDATRRDIAVACVSDGVSTSPHAEDASALAVETACAYLTGQLRNTPASFDIDRCLRRAFSAANQAVIAAAGTIAPGTWACTMVVAAWWRGLVVVGSIGDSRCYWVPQTGAAVALSTDDSLAQAQIELGVDREVAEASSGAHAITKWLGPGSLGAQPSLTHLVVEQPGWLVTCSDGLWNYASDPQAMAQALHDALNRATGPSSADTAPPAWAVCKELVDWANDQGGHDNIAVTLLRLTPADR